MDAENGKKSHHNNHKDRKEQDVHKSKKHDYEKPHKKAEIDFSSDEFADSNTSDDSPDDDQSEKGAFHEMAVCLL